MKKIIQTVSFLGLALIFGGVTANAQGPTTKVDANVPFDFTVGEKSFSAGKYTLRISRAAVGVSILELRDGADEIVQTVLLSTNGERRRESSELIFDRVEGTVVLAKIVTADAGYSVPHASGAKLVAAARRANAGASN
ncbi:MAG TPA: hypothetical protein VFZ49_08900 [Pyrinomonadaceae bacterium]